MSGLQDERSWTLVPRHVTAADAFPLNPMGKVQKFRLRELALPSSDKSTTPRDIERA